MVARLIPRDAEDLLLVAKRNEGSWGVQIGVCGRVAVSAVADGGGFISHVGFKDGKRVQEAWVGNHHGNGNLHHYMQPK